MMTYMFGKWAREPSDDDDERVKTPIGELCGTCKEPIKANDEGHFIPHLDVGNAVTMRAYHRQCELLSAIGHSYGLCYCTNYEDLSRRQAALELERRHTGVETCVHGTLISIPCEECASAAGLRVVEMSGKVVLAEQDAPLDLPLAELAQFPVLRESLLQLLTEETVRRRLPERVPRSAELTKEQIRTWLEAAKTDSKVTHVIVSWDPNRKAFLPTWVRQGQKAYLIWSRYSRLQYPVRGVFNMSMDIDLQISEFRPMHF